VTCVVNKDRVVVVRHRPALVILDLLIAQGAVVDYHETYVSLLMSGSHTLKSVPCDAAALASRDIVLILTAHASYDWAAIVHGSPLVIDTRNATGTVSPAPHVIRL